jgi:uncharacterized membrane protein
VKAAEMKSKLGIALLGILIFLLGGIAGGVSSYLYCEHLKATATIPKDDDVTEWMAHELKLDAQQKAAARVIIVDIRERYRTLSGEFRPRYEALRKESDERINALLRPDQKPLFENLLKKFRSLRPAAAQPVSSK